MPAAQMDLDLGLGNDLLDDDSDGDFAVYNKKINGRKMLAQDEVGPEETRTRIASPVPPINTPIQQDPYDMTLAEQL